MEDNFDDPPTREQQLTYTAMLDTVTAKYEQLQAIDEKILAATDVEQIQATVAESDDYLCELQLKVNLWGELKQRLQSAGHARSQTGTRHEMTVPARLPSQGQNTR